MKKLTVKFKGEFTLDEERFNWFLNEVFHGSSDDKQGVQLAKENTPEEFCEEVKWVISNAIENWLEENYTDALIHKMPYEDMKTDDDHQMVRTKVFIPEEKKSTEECMKEIHDWQIKKFGSFER